MSSESLLTLAERSAFQQTGRIDEVERLAAEFAKAWPNAVRSFEYGRSGEGRPMRALLVTLTNALTPQALNEQNIPLLMLQGGIHPGESDGKDAGFICLREMLQSNSALLKQIAILFVPAFNTDGHERVGKWNRPNQVGPEEMGWRTTATNLNLNRDYMKAASPEMQAMLRLINEWDPLVCADMHVTDGADFEPDISIQVEPIHQGDPTLFASATQLRDELIAILESKGSMPLPFYPDLYETDNPASGFVLTVYSARFSTGYFAARNRYTVLVETHSWKDYATRVRVTKNTIYGLAELTARHGSQWLALTRQVDKESRSVAGKDLHLDFAAGWREPTAGSPDSRTDEQSSIETIEFRGYAYTRKRSEISGDWVTTYDPKTPQIWRVPFRKNTAPSLIVKAPAHGYIVPCAYAQAIAEKLAQHGIRTEQLTKDDVVKQVEVFRVTHARFATHPFEGCMRATLTGEWQSESRVIPAASLFVPIAQSHSRLLMALLEPQAPDSLAAWGFFNSSFEQKEHIEPYVAELIARDMLTKDSNLAKEFQAKLDSNKTFASDPQARLDFFLQRHASWDERYNMYPVYRF